MKHRVHTPLRNQNISTSQFPETEPKIAKSYS